MKKILTVFLVLFMTIACCACGSINNEPSHDWQEGHDAGYKSGYYDGYNEGYQDAFDEHELDLIQMRTGAQEAIRIWESLDVSITEEYIDDDDMMMYLRGILELSENLLSDN